MSEQNIQATKQSLNDLQNAILKKDRENSDQLAHKVKDLASEKLHKTFFDHTIELIGAVIFALILATIIRQAWFEPYEIPTGSMRPTFKEKDRLIVTKTNFGLNIPLKPDHFYFQPDTLKNTNIVTFTVQNMAVREAQTKYFKIFPGYKRYIKRLIGKPGDSVYFYGGKIYAVDKNGNDIKILRTSPDLNKIEHIPYIRFEGNNKNSALDQKKQNITATIRQFNQLLGKISISPHKESEGYVFVNDRFITEKYQEGAASPSHYSDFYGIGNFATARLLKKDELPKNIELEDAPLYLELIHHPSLSGSNLEIWPMPGLLMNTEHSFLPLQKEHLDRILKNLYTARFTIKDEKAAHYHPGKISTNRNSPEFINIGDGTYEFYYGQAYKVAYGGIAKKLPSEHPFYKNDAENIQKLFNLGIEFSNIFQPHNNQSSLLPSRFSYFRDGDLYLMGAPIVFKNEPILKNFNSHELSKSGSHYIPFIDHGAPIKNDSIDGEFIRNFGLTVPENMYLVLGDNHAQSADSREFGFVPATNLRGAPLINLWPPGSRWGLHHSQPFINRTSLIWWIITGLSLIGIVQYRKIKVKNIDLDKL